MLAHMEQELETFYEHVKTRDHFFRDTDVKAKLFATCFFRFLKKSRPFARELVRMKRPAAAKEPGQMGKRTKKMMMFQKVRLSKKVLKRIH